jgi:prevent-host-death family protein
MDESSKGTAAASGTGETVTVSGAEAKARFDELIARARRGAEVVVTEDGRAVARIVGAGAADAATIEAARQEAMQATLSLARAGYKSERSWTRDELYER